MKLRQPDGQVRLGLRAHAADRRRRCGLLRLGRDDLHRDRVRVGQQRLPNVVLLPIRHHFLLSEIHINILVRLMRNNVLYILGLSPFPFAPSAIEKVSAAVCVRGEAKNTSSRTSLPPSQGQLSLPLFPSLSLSSAADILWSRMQSGQRLVGLHHQAGLSFRTAYSPKYLPRKFQQMVGIFYLPSRAVHSSYLNPTIAAESVLDQCRGNGGGCGRVEE